MAGRPYEKSIVVSIEELRKVNDEFYDNIKALVDAKNIIIRGAADRDGLKRFALRILIESDRIKIFDKDNKGPLAADCVKDLPIGEIDLILRQRYFHRNSWTYEYRPEPRVVELPERW